VLRPDSAFGGFDLAADALPLGAELSFLMAATGVSKVARFAVAWELTDTGDENSHSSF
jgi:hypothetical protein